MLAGKYAGAIRKKAGEISRDPVQSAAAAGAAGAGLATLGNVVSGESEREGAGRTALEALGAGAYAAAAGAHRLLRHCSAFTSDQRHLEPRIPDDILRGRGQQIAGSRPRKLAAKVRSGLRG